MAEERKTSRRDFFKGVSARERVDAWLDELSPGSLAASQMGGGYLLRFARRAMACQFELLFSVDEPSEASDWALAALDSIDSLERQLTVYGDDSEVISLNRRAHSEPTVVEPGLFGLLQKAVALSRETGGAVDITSGPLSKCWGFYRRQGVVPKPEELAGALASVGHEHLLLHSEDRSVRFARRGMEINLGAIGKGHALDVTAEQLVRRGLRNFLWHGGQSSVLARGNEPGAAADRLGWTVGIAHPVLTGVRVGEVRLVDRALGTSGSAVQWFEHEGKRYGHIVDPRSGWPAEGVTSVTVAAPTAAEADALATAFYVMGADAAQSYCDSHLGVSAIFILPTTDPERWITRAMGFEDDTLRLAAETDRAAD